MCYNINNSYGKFDKSPLNGTHIGVECNHQAKGDDYNETNSQTLYRAFPPMAYA